LVVFFLKLICLKEFSLTKPLTILYQGTLFSITLLTLTLFPMLILGSLLLDQYLLPLGLKTINSLVVHPPNQTKDVTSNKVTHYVTHCHILKHHVGSIFLEPPHRALLSITYRNHYPTQLIHFSFSAFKIVPLNILTSFSQIH
jgi:hypothetical protein